MVDELTFCELREKEVINTIDGRKLGRTIDLVLTCSGNVLGIVVPGERKAFRSIASNQTLFVPWKCITKIGEDTILVCLTGGVDSCSNHDKCDDNC